MTELYRRTNAVYLGNTCRGDFEQNFQPGKIYSEDAIPDYLTAEQVAELFEYIGDGPPTWTTVTKPQLVEYARSLHAWIIGPVAQQLRQDMILSPMFNSGPVEVTLPGLVLPLMGPLIAAAPRVGIPMGLETPTDITSALGVLVELAKHMPEGQPKESGSARAVEVMLGEESKQILDIAQSDKSAEDRMRIICRIDRRHLAWDSPTWSKLLGVSAAAIRKTTFWTKERDSLIEADRD